MTATKSPDTQNTGPLAGVTIVDCTSVVLGAYAMQILGDLGAEVIKIEAPTAEGSPGGDILRWGGKSPKGPGMGPLFMTYNRNKRSVMLDLKKEEAREALRTLIKDADVFASNIRYAGMERLGIDYDSIKKINPEIVYVHAAGFGKDGAYGGLQAYDDLIQAASGGTDLLPRVNQRAGLEGEQFERPAYLPSLVADKTTGLHMVYATLAALYHKQRTGEGQFVEVPMLECFTSFTMSENLYGHCFEPPVGGYGYSRVLNPNRRPFKTKDGYLSIVPYSDRQWDDFFELGGRKGLLQEDDRFNTYQNRTQNVLALYALVEEVAQTRTSEEWIDLLKEKNIPAMRVNRLDDVTSDPHLQSIGFFEHYDHPQEGTYVAMKQPVNFEKTPATHRHHPPALGVDTEAVLREAGLSNAEIAAVSKG